MASDSLSEVREAAGRQLAAALDAIEMTLDTLPLGAEPAEVARALADPIRTFDAAAREAMS